MGARAGSGRRLELDLDEGEFELIGIDDVVLDAHGPVVGATGGEVGEGILLAVVEEQLAGRQRHDDIVVAMAVPASLRARGEAPFRDLDALVVDLDRGDRRRSRHCADLRHGRTPPSLPARLIADAWERHRRLPVANVGSPNGPQPCDRRSLFAAGTLALLFGMQARWSGSVQFTTCQEPSGCW